MGDYNNDGWNDLFVSYYGQNALFRNNGNGTFTDVTKEAGLLQDRLRWNSGCTFLDYDKDGHLDLFVGNYIDLDLKTTPLPEDANCTYKGILVACGPPGLEGGKNLLYRNNGDGTFTDVSAEGRHVGHARHLCTELRPPPTSTTPAGPISTWPTTRPRPPIT